MRVVSTVTWGWTAADIAQRQVAAWAASHPGAWVMLRGGWWLVTHPIKTLGAGIGVWLWSRGWPLLLAAPVGALLPGAWAVRGAWGVLRVSSVARDAPRDAWAPKALWTRLRRWRALRRHWSQAAAHAAILNRKTDAVPRLLNVRATTTGLTAVINCGAVGVTADKVAKSGDVLAAAVPGCRQVTVTPDARPGWASLHFQWADPLAAVVPLSQLPASPRGRLAFGVTENGDAASIAKFKSVLIVGQSGSGKSTLVWSLLASVLADGVPVRLRVVDPAGGVELHALKDSPLTHDYASTPSSAEQLIKRMHGGMTKRLREMSGTARMHKPTPQHPWDILIIDELLLMEKLLKAGTGSPLGEILSIGRKAAYSVWALTQIPHIDTIGRVRNLFVQKLVLATDTREMTDAVLGDGAEAAGAKCSKIRESTPGVGYAAIEGTRGYPRFRGVWVPDDMARIIAKGYLPDQVPRHESTGASLSTDAHVMYGWYGPDGDLLYIGISNDGPRRAMEHLRDKEWAREPGITMKILERFDDRASALAAEEEAIKAMHPAHNVVHKQAASPGAQDG